MKSGINSINWNFDNSYSKLPNSFKENVKPVKVKKPKLVLLNENLSKELDLNFSNIDKFIILNILEKLKTLNLVNSFLITENLH